MKTLVFLCQKSIVIRQKMMEKEKFELAEEDKCEISQEINEDEEDEIAIISDDEDEDDDYDANEIDEELYDSKFDDIDEVILFRDTFFSLQTQNPELYNFYFSALNDMEKQHFQ